jgi:hypothetical protein
MSFHARLQAEIDEESVEAFSHGARNSEDSERRILRSGPTTTVNLANEKRHPNDKSALGITSSLRGGGGYQPQHHKVKSSKHSVPRVPRTAPIQYSCVNPFRGLTPRPENRLCAETVEPIEDQAQEQEPENATQGQILSRQSGELQIQIVQDFHPSFSPPPSTPMSCVSLLREALAALDTNDMSAFDKTVDEAKILQQTDINGCQHFYVLEVASERIRSRKVEEAEKARDMIAKRLEILEKGSHVKYYQHTRGKLRLKGDLGTDRVLR